MQAIAIAEKVGRRFGFERPLTLVACPKMSDPMAFSRLRCERHHHGRTMAVPPEEAFVLHAMLTPLPSTKFGSAEKLGKRPRRCRECIEERQTFVGNMEALSRRCDHYIPMLLQICAEKTCASGAYQKDGYRQVGDIHE
jgi:hypothetical protein